MPSLTRERELSAFEFIQLENQFQKPQNNLRKQSLRFCCPRTIFGFVCQGSAEKKNIHNMDIYVCMHLYVYVYIYVCTVYVYVHAQRETHIKRLISRNYSCCGAGKFEAYRIDQQTRNSRGFYPAISGVISSSVGNFNFSS